MSLRARFSKSSLLGLPVAASPLAPVTDAELLRLPDPAQRYLRFMGIVGRPRDWSFRASFIGRFKIKRSAPWRPCQVWQHNTGPVVSRTFFMQLCSSDCP